MPQRACKKNEDKFRNMVESTSDWIWQIDQNNVYTYSSPKVKEILGYSPEEVVGKSPFDLMPKEEAKRIAKIFEEISSSKEPFHGIENWNIHKNGNLVLLETSGVPLVNKNGLLTGYRGIDRDITKRKKAEDRLRQSEERFSKIFHSNPAAIVISRYADGLIIDVNNTFLRLSGYTYEEVIGQTSTELELFANSTDRSRMTNLLLKQSAVSNCLMSFQTKEGELKETIFSAEKIKIGNEDCIISTVLDVTERRKLERKLEEHTRNLEKVVRERTDKLKDAERLAAIGQTAGMVGHDIRNPLQAIVGDLYLLKTEIENIPDREIKRSLLVSVDSINENVQYISKIVNDLRDFSQKMEPKIEEINLKKEVQRVLSNIRTPEKVKIEYSVDTDLTLRTDKEYFERILTNLVVNAFQAIPKDGQITVSAIGQNEIAQIIVADTGEGIPGNLQEKIFAPFFTTKAKGQGLGLTVVKKLVDKLGGTLSVESQIGKGTTFKVGLPKE